MLSIPTGELIFERNVHLIGLTGESSLFVSRASNDDGAGTYYHTKRHCVDKILKIGKEGQK